MRGELTPWRLTAGCFQRFRGFVRSLLSLGAVVIVAGLDTLSYAKDLSEETILFLVMFVLLVLTAIIGAILARTACKGKCGPTRFMLWLILWTVLGSVFAAFALALVTNFILSSGSSLSDVPEVLLASATDGIVLGLGLCMFNLPFMILGFVNPFFRDRLCGCLSLHPEADAAMPSNANDIAE